MTAAPLTDPHAPRWRWASPRFVQTIASIISTDQLHLLHSRSSAPQLASRIPELPTEAAPALRQRSRTHSPFQSLPNLRASRTRGAPPHPVSLSREGVYRVAYGQPRTASRHDQSVQLVARSVAKSHYRTLRERRRRALRKASAFPSLSEWYRLAFPRKHRRRLT